MEIKRDLYLNRLIESKHNGLIKIITGIRRCGKSYLLFKLFHNYLLSQGVDEKHIIEIALDDYANKNLRNPDNIYNYVKGKIEDTNMYYIILDEVQFLDEFEDVLNGFLHFENVDIYVTGSNSKFLSSDIITEFRGRGYEIRVYPVSFSEFVSVYNGSIDAAWKDYYTFGGIPLVLTMETEEQKSKYLDKLLREVYLADVIERNRINNDYDLDELVSVVASSIGSLTNPRKLANTFRSEKKSKISEPTVKSYLDYLMDSFMIEKAIRYDIKGRKYINTPAKYYFADLGLRNAKLNFRQQEENHIMENIIFNELKVRGYGVDVGMVEINAVNNEGKKIKKQLEVDFIAYRGNKKYYIQSAFEMMRQEKKEQEEKSLINIGDSFKKIIVVKDDIKPKFDDMGILTIGIKDFLLNENSLDL